MCAVRSELTLYNTYCSSRINSSLC